LHPPVADADRRRQFESAPRRTASLFAALNVVRAASDGFSRGASSFGQGGGDGSIVTAGRTYALCA